MKSMTTNSFAKSLTSVLLILITLSIGAQDVIEIPVGIDENGPTLFNAIMGDTTATGERAHPNAIYRLSRGQIYPIEGGMFINFDITIDAVDDDPADPQRPPMIIPKADPQGNLPYALIWSIAENNMNLKNLMFNAVQNTIESTLGRHAVVTKGGRTSIDNCVFTGFTESGVTADGGNGYRVFITNSVFRNIQAPTAWWVGSPFTSWATNGDTLVFNNNTAINCSGTIVSTNWEDAYTNYLEVSHNTILGGNFNVVGSMSTTYGVFTDNLIVDAYAMGIDTSGTNASWCDPDALTSAIFPIDTNAVVKMQEELGLVEADRRMEVHNNAYFWSDAVKAHWKSRGAQFPDPPAVFMNERDIAMYADDEAYPLLNISNNIEEDPLFVNTDMQAEIDAGYAKYGNELFDSFIPGKPAFEGYLHHYPGGDGMQDVTFFVEWPLAEDLSYTNSALLTHSTTGGPVGDSRWYTTESTGIFNSSLAEVQLSNYPNPFTESTSIIYSIQKNSEVKLSVYDISGREVAVLDKQYRASGTYQVDWDGTNHAGLAMPGGIYIYQIRMRNSINTQKMLLVR